MEKETVVKKGGDIETGNVVPKITGNVPVDVAEDPRLRWAFIRKVYAILTVQFLFTAGVGVACSILRPIPAFVRVTPLWGQIVVYVGILILPLIAIWPMLCYRKRHPINMIFLAIFTVCISLNVGMQCAILRGTIVLQATVLSAGVLIGLTLYTFWAARRGCDFSFLCPFLGASLLVLILYLIMQIYFPLGRTGSTIYGCLGTIVFSAFIIFDTDNLIKRHKYDEYTVAAVALYLDVINLFNSMLFMSAIDP